MEGNFGVKRVLMYTLYSKLGLWNRNMVEIMLKIKLKYWVRNPKTDLFSRSNKDYALAKSLIK
jgi:hypothetical protein